MPQGGRHHVPYSVYWGSRQAPACSRSDAASRTRRRPVQRPSSFTEEACSMIDARYGALGVLNDEGSVLTEFVTVGAEWG